MHDSRPMNEAIYVSSLQTIATSAHTRCGIPHLLASIENNACQQRSKVRFAVELVYTYAAHCCFLKDQCACGYGVIVAKCHHCDSVVFTSWHWRHQFLSFRAHPLIHSGNYAEVPVRRGSGYARVVKQVYAVPRLLGLNGPLISAMFPQTHSISRLLTLRTCLKNATLSSRPTMIIIFFSKIQIFFHHATHATDGGES